MNGPGGVRVLACIANHFLTVDRVRLGDQGEEVIYEGAW